jgi:hypothetical protein
MQSRLNIDDILAALDMVLESIEVEKRNLRETGADAFRGDELDLVEACRDQLGWLQSIEKDLLNVTQRCRDRAQDATEKRPPTSTFAPLRSRETVQMEGYTLEVNHPRQSILPGSGLRDAQFQELARFALDRGEFDGRRHSPWVRRNGYLSPDPEDYIDEASFERSAYRHLEKALYRIALADGLIKKR